MHEIKKIAFFSYHGVNKYVAIMISIIKSVGNTEVVPFELQDCLSFKKRFWSADAVWLNWYDTGYKAKGILLKLLVLLLLKIGQKRIIHVMHDKQEHDLSANRLPRLLTRSIFFFADTIIIHSQISRQFLPAKYHRKIVYIPHPNYIGDYGEIVPTDDTDDKLKLLLIGMLRPYKNIELLIEAMRPFEGEAELTIAGKPAREGYGQELLKLPKGDNVKFVFEFIEDGKMPQYLAKCDLLVLPYNTSSSLNSGVAILAFSYKKTVICPPIGTLEDMKNKEFLTYSFTDRESHLQHLKEQIKKAIELKKQNHSIFAQWGETMYEEVADRNSKQRVEKIIEKEVLCNHP